MNNLPVEWKLSSLGEVCEIEMGQSPPSESYNEDGIGLPFFQGKAEFGKIFPTPRKWCSSPQKIALPGSILISVRAPVGPTNLAQEKSCIGRGLAALLPKSDVNIQYVYYYLKFIEKEWDQKATGTTFKAITGQVLRQQEIPIPPYPEQSKIVEKIEELLTELEAGVSALKRVQVNLKRYKASVLKAACEGRLVTTEAELARREDRPYESGADLLRRILAERREKWAAEQRSRGKDPAKMKYEEPRGPESENLPELPEGWCWATVEQVGDHRLGKMLDKQKNKGELRPYLRNANVRWFSFDLDDIQYMRVDEGELNEVTVEKGDVVICEGGEPGRAAVWEKNERFVIQKALHRVRLPKGIVPWYLVYYLSYSANTGILEKYFTGSTIKHFTGESLRSFVFALPPFDEQCRIVAEIENRFVLVTKNEVVVGKTAIRADRLRQSILKRAFEGRLVGETEKTSAV